MNGSTSDFGPEGSGSIPDGATKFTNMKTNLKTKFAAWLVKCAQRIDPQSNLYNPSLPPLQEGYMLSLQTKSVERIAVKYEMPVDDDENEEGLKMQHVFSGIATAMANELLKSGHIKMTKSIDSSYYPRIIQWVGTLHVVKI